jgi:hypothetical protein
MRQGQRWATIWSQLRTFTEENPPSDMHAEEVVDPLLLIDETVHGGQEVAADIEQSPSSAANGQQQQGGNGGTDGEKQQGEEESVGDEQSEQGDGSGSAGQGKEADGSDGGALGDGMSAPVELEEATGDEVMFFAIRQVLQHLADNPDRWRHQQGKGHWEKRQLIKARFAPQTLPRARYTYPHSPNNIFLIVDESNSVSELADQIKALVAGALGVVRVFAGSEAHPDKEYTLGYQPRSIRENLQWNTAWSQEYVHDFTASVRGFLAYACPVPGARLLFWGDTMDMHLRDSERLRSLLKGYRPLWLLSHDGRSSYSGYEAPRLEAAGIPVIKEIIRGEALLAALRRI